MCSLSINYIPSITMLFFGQKNSPILTSSEVVNIECDKCGAQNTTSFHFFVSYVCLNFGIPLFPWKSNVISDCNSCNYSIAEEAFPPKLKQAYEESFLSTSVPLKYYAFGVITIVLGQIIYAYGNSDKGGLVPVFFGLINLVFMFGMFKLFSVALKGLGKNPYLALISLIPGIGFLIVIGLLIYYSVTKNNNTLISQSNDSADRQQPTFGEILQPQKESIESSIPTSNILGVEEFDDLMNKTLTLGSVEYSYLLETIMYNMVWYIRIHQLNPESFHLDRLATLYEDEKRMILTCKSSALGEELDNLTAIIEARNKKIVTNYNPKSVDILIQNIIFFHTEQSWTLGNYTEQTQTLLRTFNIPELTMQRFWFDNAKKIGLDLSVNHKKEVDPEFNEYRINNIFDSYHFFIDTILMLQIWYLKANGCDLSSFESGLFKEKCSDAKLRLELFYWELYDMPLDNLKLKVKKYVEMTRRKFGRSQCEYMLSEVGYLQSQKVWKFSFYTETSGELLSMFDYPSLQHKRFWRDILDRTPLNNILEKVREQSNGQSVVRVSEYLLVLEIENKKDFLIDTAFLTRVWYLRENGMPLEQFNLIDGMEENFKDWFEEFYVQKIEEIEYRVFGRIRTLRQYFEEESIQFLLKEVAKIHKQKAWRLSDFTEITSDLLDVIQVKDDDKRDVWNNAISGK